MDDNTNHREYAEDAPFVGRRRDRLARVVITNVFG